MIYIAHKRRSLERIQKQYPNACILDITSNSNLHDTQILSPFYPHGNIPIPFTEGLKASCVEAVWQGLKVFENEGVSFETFQNSTMKSLKRTIRKYGKPKGHLKGAYGSELLNYFEARMLIYLPTYKWMLDNVQEVHSVVMKIKEISKTRDVILLDYNTNVNFLDITKPISHASLVKLYIEDNYPTSDDLTIYTPIVTKEKRKKSKKDKLSKSKKIVNDLEPSLFE